MPGLGSLSPHQVLAIWDQAGTQAGLERSLTVLAALREESAQRAAEIDVGTRDVLLARYLSALNRGPMATCADCPCGARLDVPVDIGLIAGLSVHERGETLRVTVDEDEVVFRLPTSADLTLVDGASSPRTALLERCVGRPLDALPPSELAQLTEAVDAAMETAAPAGAVDVRVRCPECDTETSFALDVSVLLWAEIEAQATQLIGDVHTLARTFGWTESDVLALSPRRRATYLALAEA